MVIEIKNFGPIGYLKFDLAKDLHLIYGENAIGKSYATYCIYCLLKSILNNNYFVRTRGHSKQITQDILKEIKINEPYKCTDKVIEVIQNSICETILKDLENSFKNTFSSLKNLKNRYSNKNYEIIVHFSEVEYVKIFSDNYGKIDVKYVSQNMPQIEILSKNTKTSKFSLYVDNNRLFNSPSKEHFSEMFEDYCRDELYRVFKQFRIDNIRDIYYLPASRSGLYQALNAFTPIIAELTQNRFFLKNKSIELPSLSEPLSDYFIDLSTLDKNRVNEEYNEIIEFLEQQILRGEVEYDEKNKKILYKPKDIDLELNLSEASSMVSELSPLVLYFRHILNNKYGGKGVDFQRHFLALFNKKEPKEKRQDILFIEEPEAHLHPEVQVKLMEIFAKLGKKNIKLFMTSHSDYMFNKMNNLLIKKEVEEESVAVYHLVKDKDGSTINGNMKITEDGINDDNFQDISEKLYMERLEYLANEA